MSQSTTGLALAAALMAAWAATLAYDLSHAHAAPGACALIALQTWLDVGLFIVAHDAMHGSLAPASRRINRAVGRLCLLLYAGFGYRKIEAAHFRHHRFAGTAADPDFSASHPRSFLPWFAAFMRRYFGWRELAGLAAAGTALVVLLHRPPGRVFLFWALPAILSALQLFLFGTYLPHRHGEAPFADRHRARSSGFPYWLSLLTCFHFGYHHEHHQNPGVPWWRLPAVRRGAAARSPG